LRARVRHQSKDAKKRICNKCGKSKPANEKYFAPRDGDRLRGWCRVCDIAYKTDYARKNRHRWKERASAYQRKRSYKLKYGLTVEQYEEMAAAQDWKCSICRRRYFKQPRRLCVDHDHATGAVRGLLCVACNRGIGYFEDNPDRLRAAAVYLEVQVGNRETP
jgi:hypothetical protein